MSGIKSLKQDSEISNFLKDKEIIDKYSKLVVKCWEEGFTDRTYNFTVNNGIDKNGNVVLIDFGEITTNKKDIEKEIIFERWKRAGCYKRRISGETKKYYKRKMEELLTTENLNKYWNSN